MYVQILIWNLCLTTPVLKFNVFAFKNKTIGNDGNQYKRLIIDNEMDHRFLDSRR
jgi:hypothetical protein